MNPLVTNFGLEIKSPQHDAVKFCSKLDHLEDLACLKVSSFLDATSNYISQLSLMVKA